MNEYICTKKLYKQHYMDVWFKSKAFGLSVVIGIMFVLYGIYFCMTTKDEVNYLINSIWILGGLYIAFGRGFVRANSRYKYLTKVHLMENWRNRATFEDDRIVFLSEIRGKEEKDWIVMPILYEDITSVIVKGNAITINVKVGVVSHLYKDCFIQMTYEDFCKIIKEKCRREVIEK